MQFFRGTDIHRGVLVGNDHNIDLKVAVKVSFGKLGSPIDSIIMIPGQGEAIMNDARTIDADTYVRNVHVNCVLTFRF